jgi:hypothetical protein
MKKILIYFPLFLIIVLASCSRRIPLNSNYFNSDSKVGMVVSSKVQYAYGKSSGALMGVIVGGIIDAATKPKQKYDSALSVLAPQLDPKERMKKVYRDALEVKGKKVIALDSGFKKGELKLFSLPTNTDKKYSKIDYRFLNEKYQWDELLRVHIYYGVYSHFSYGMETWKAGRTLVIAEIINLKDNSIIYKDYSRSLVRFSGEWDTPPEYKNIKAAIAESTNRAIAAVGTIKVKNAKKK